MDTKRCSKCGDVKLVSEFGKNKSKCDGLQAWCKHCHALHTQRRRRENAVIKKGDKRKSKRAYCCVDNNLYIELKREAEKYGMQVSQLLRGMVYFYFDNYKD